jgi:tRNA-dihydrouridine synthase
MEYHLAPMKNITCWAFRNSIYGISDSYTEMINLKQLISKDNYIERVVDTFPIQTQKQWIQVLTHNTEHINRLPSSLTEFEEKCPDKRNIYGVSINASCPDPSVIAAGDGAALIKRTKRLVDLIISFLDSTEKHQYHINIKFRLGLNSQDLQYNKIFDFLEEMRLIKDTRISPPIIHFRHARQASKSKPHWELLKELLSAKVPIIINGGITAPKNLELIKLSLPLEWQKEWQKLIIGIMIGQGVLENPMCFCNFKEDPNNLENSHNFKAWALNFVKNIKLHPPDNRFILNFKKFYPTVFKLK